MSRLVFLFSLLLALPLEAAPRRRAVTPATPFPLCSMVMGTGAVTFTRNHGATLAASNTPLTGIGYTYGLAALDQPNTLMAWHKHDLLLSTDAGCSWRVVATFDDWDFPPSLTPARGGRVYAWSDNRRYMIRYDARGAVKLKPPADFVGIGVDRTNGDRIRGGGNDGTVWESTDGGDTWTQLGALEGAIGYYRFAFDPANLDHVVAGTPVKGAFVSFDGGRTWSAAEGIGTRDKTNVFNLVVSPADGNRVWAMALDMDRSSRRIWRSDDGGRTYVPAVEAGNGVTLVNGPVMAAHPTNRDVLYFVFGTKFQGYGTDFFRYDASIDQLTMTHNDHHDINAIAFSPHDPNVIYLGLEVEAGH